MAEILSGAKNLSFELDFSCCLVLLAARAETSRKTVRVAYHARSHERSTPSGTFAAPYMILSHGTYPYAMNKINASHHLSINGETCFCECFNLFTWQFSLHHWPRWRVNSCPKLFFFSVQGSRTASSRCADKSVEGISWHERFFLFFYSEIVEQIVCVLCPPLKIPKKGRALVHACLERTYVKPSIPA